MSDPDTSTTSTDPADVQPDSADSTTDVLSDAGKRALDEMKGKWHSARDGLKPWTALAREFGVKDADGLRALINGKTEQAEATDPDRIKREAQAEADTRANARIVRAEVKALAADLFADAADAALYLDLSKYDVDVDGEVDADAIKTDLHDLLKRKPHLAKSPEKRFQGGADGGPRGETVVTDNSPKGNIMAGLRAAAQKR